uniref:Reverse transcriptase domain-containing protein n=1 Tax=Amphimedon queenslandica TaxID=400682 RepID=A0A1X7SU22_AMPQE
MRNILTICPAFARIIINTYRADTNLFIGGQTIFSSEGTTQGDPLAMSMYALATVPLIRRLSSPSVIQSWYADDATAAGRLQTLREWWDGLVEAGPLFGYFPNSVKTWLLVKPSSADDAKAIFEDTNISITTEGRPVLGSPIGTSDYINKYVESQVSDWNCELRLLSEIAMPHPHAAFAAYTHGFVNKWTYLCR